MRATPLYLAVIIILLILGLIQSFCHRNDPPKIPFRVTQTDLEQIYFNQ